MLRIAALNHKSTSCGACGTRDANTCIYPYVDSGRKEDGDCDWQPNSVCELEEAINYKKPGCCFFDMNIPTADDRSKYASMQAAQNN